MIITVFNILGIRLLQCVRPMSGPSGWSVKHDRFGSIYMTIYLHDLYSDAHTVDTSKHVAKFKVDSSLQHVYPRRQP